MPQSNNSWKVSPLERKAPFSFLSHWRTTLISLSRVATVPRPICHVSFVTVDYEWVAMVTRHGAALCFETAQKSQEICDCFPRPSRRAFRMLFIFFRGSGKTAFYVGIRGTLKWHIFGPNFPKHFGRFHDRNGSNFTLDSWQIAK